MPFDASGNYTARTGTVGVVPGQVIRSAMWNSIFNDLATALTQVARKEVQPQRSVTAGPVTVGPTDVILTLNLSSPTTITLPTAASRNGGSITFVDVGKKAGSNNVLLAPSGGDTILNAPNPSTGFTINMPGQAVTLYPCTDGVNTGWFLL